MIKEGQFTIIGGKTFQVVRIEDNFAYLHNVETYMGRPRKMLVSQVPYFDENGQLIVPEIKKTQIPKRKLISKVNIREIAKEQTDKQVSKKAIMFIEEQVRFLCEYLIINADETADKHNHTRIGPEHVCHIQFPELHTEICIDHKQYIEDGL